ncbi:MAG: primosomal protein N' [Gemmataceae bacterium]|nr:primosomal protein N' [Gemmataceae bacterium]
MDVPQRNLFGEAEAQTEAAVLFAEIVFDRPLDHAYSYGVPSRLRDLVAVGKRVLAPFGRGDRQTVGFCVGLTSTAPQREVKNIVQVLDDEPLLTPQLLKLTRWMADYYLCSWGQVLNAVVPAGAKELSGTRAIIMVEPLPPMLRPTPLPALTPKQKKVLEILDERHEPIEIRELGRQANCAAGPIRALIKSGLARRRITRVERELPSEEDDPTTRDESSSSAGLVLTPDQLQASAVLEQAVRAGGFKPFLLHGVTGSGKTELYLRAIEQVVREGKSALVLVPEISLTPQTIRAFQGRCGEVAVMHSHMHQGERGGHWRRIAAGQVQVVVGARSAVFAPTQNLGLIVIDEEHESTFKQEATPRYHGRDVAVMRARFEDIPIILGSATPSMESWHNAQRGQYTLLSLPKRVFDRPLPQVHLIDLRHDRHPDKRLHGISPTLERAMTHALDLGGQVILLLNRRGFSTYIHCPACGHVEQCKFCDLALTYHKERDLMLCHYCGYEQEPALRCPDCGLGQVKYQGMGTEKLQLEIEAKFPRQVLRRMDSDTMRRPGSHKQTLDAFRRGEIHILLGTQMIAKGLDFPNVTLVGVVNADVALHRADFRASERTFQLLAQVAGRTGRGPRGGKVFVQTFSTDHPAISMAAVHDYLGFAKAELGHRRPLNYPPYHRMARLILRSRKQEAASECADRLAGAFRAAVETVQAKADAADLRILGPAEAPVFKLKGYFRYHFQLQSSSSGFLHQVLRQTLPSVKLPKDVELTLDIDPQDMM